MDKKELFILLSTILFIFTQSSAQLPETYDLRDRNLVTRIKAQKSGTCWCFGTMSGIEGNLLLTGNWEAAGQTDEPDMAEYHLSWWSGFAQSWNYDLYPDVEDPNGVPDHSGGDYKIFCAYMSRLDGPVREIDAPGDASVQIPSQKTCPLYKDTHMRWYVPDIDWFFIDNPDEPVGNNKYIDTIKNVLIRNGVMPTNYLVGTEFTGEWNGAVTHYQPPEDTGQANHSVAIIGWDDNAVTKAGDSKKGAWLCKNSWGNTQSYFFISYYDKHCCRNAEMSVVAFKNVQPLPYKGVYYHDYHGWRDTLTIAKEAFNKFVGNSDSTEYLVAVSFITAVDHDEWEVKVYDTFEGGELKEELSSASGTITHAGYHTRSLDQPVTLKKDDDFYIYAKFTKGFQAYDRTCSPPVLTEHPRDRAVIVRSVAAADQSYYRTGENEPWIDFITYDDTTDWDSTGNFCIKGFTSDTFITDIALTVELPKTRNRLHNYPNPFTTHTTINYSISENSTVSLAIYTAAGRQIRTLMSKQCTAGTHQIVWNGMDKFNRLLSNGIYYAVLSVKTTHGTVTERKRMFLLK